jgi:ABC-2 type transport system permease protein
MKKIKDMFRSAHSRYGTYSALLIVVVIAIVIMLNLVAGQLPESWKNIDLSSEKLYDISDESKTLLKSLDQEVEIHVLAAKETADERIRIFVEKYETLSPKLSVKWTDPELHPSVLTENKWQANSIIVSCKGTEKTTTVNFTDIILYDDYLYQTQGVIEETFFDAEGQLTSAVNYVVSDFHEVIYYTSGHGEQPISDTIKTLLSKGGYDLKELKTISLEKIPENCKLLFLNGPTVDILDGEKELLTNYLLNGGNVLLNFGVTLDELPNLEAIMKTYGLKMCEGFIYDEERYLSQDKFFIYPNLYLSEKLAKNIQSGIVGMMYARGLEIVDPERDTIQTNYFMTTSFNAYAMTEDNSVKGAYALGATAVEDGRLTVIGSPSLIAEAITDNYSQLENGKLFINIVNNHFDNPGNVVISAKKLGVSYNTMQYTGISTLVVILVVPAALLLYGFFTWLKRRKT